MKRTLFYSTLIIAFLISPKNLFAQLQKEVMQTIYPLSITDSVISLKPGNSFESQLSFDEGNYPKHRYLRIIGGTKMPGNFKPRGETLFRKFEFLIDDCLDSLIRTHDRYSLYFQGNNDPFERHAYNRISIPAIKAGKATIETNIKRNNLQTASNGDFGIELQLYYKKTGRHQDEIYDAPDSIIYMPVPSGSGNFMKFRQAVVFPENIATVLIRVGGTLFRGECWVEAPTISQEKSPLVSMPFVPNDRRGNDYNYWTGINMVSRNWPLWKLEFNNKTIFQGNIFDRASDIADFYIKLPENIDKQGNLKLTLLKDHDKAVFPYEIRSVQLIEESAKDYEIVSVPRYVTVGDTSGILFEANRPGVSINISTGKSLHLFQTKYTFDKPGLYAVSLTALYEDVNIPVTISDGTNTQVVFVQQTINKEKDNVYLSSGDEIHIDKVQKDYDYFFKWYIRERIGNWYQFRPSYQWSGVRITDESVIKHYTGLLNNLQIPYAWQVEGRTLAASRINPPLESLQSPMFRGKQAHENDGGYYYWQHFKYEGLHSDMAARTRPYGGIFAKHPPIYTDHGIFIHYDPFAVKDMKDGASTLVSNFSYSRGESSRHTGPSTLFRYLYQAGYSWLGAEQMYGPEDIIMSALRGASRAYGKTNYGSLHAVQWGSYPFTDPKHALRFYMSLAVAYMHGSSHINTEEGLWTDEYANDRFTQAGKNHMYSQHRILDFIQTHSRKGELHTKIAVIQGRNDAWKSFGRGSLWSQSGEKWKFNKACESFDLLKVFYPENIVDGCGPEGWFTATPYGAVDILPVEAGNDVLERYNTLIFLGWNTFDEKDFERIGKFVENGGTLLLTAAHLNAELQPDLPAKFPNNDHLLKKILGEDYRNYTSKKDITYGKGHIVYFPQASYPAEQNIREEYTRSMNDLAAKAISKENLAGWIGKSPYIDFSVWDSSEQRAIYLLNTDWKSDTDSHSADLLLNNHVFTVKIGKYTLPVIRCAKEIAAMAHSNTSDILTIEKSSDGWNLSVQTTEDDVIDIFNGLTGKQESIIISGAGIHRLKIASPQKTSSK